MKNIVKILIPLIPKLSLILLLVLVWTTSEALLLYMLKWIVDNFTHLPLENSSKWFLCFSIFVIVVFVIEISIRIANFLHAYVLPEAAFQLRKNLVDRLLSRNLLFFNQKKIGDLASRITELPQAVENIIKTSLYGIIAGSFNFFVITILVLLDLGTLALYFIIWYISMMLIGGYYVKETSRLSQNYAHRVNLANAELTELLQNILNIKIAAKEIYENSRIKGFFLNVAQDQNLLEMLVFKIDTIRGVISGTLLISLFGFVLHDVLDNSASVGDLVFVISSAFIARRDIWRVSLQLTEIYKDVGFIKEVEIFTDSEHDDQELKNKAILKEIDSIKLESASFGFFDGSFVFKNLNLEIKKGLKVAVVGPSGVGKTTMAKALQGIYKLQEGGLLINGCEASNFTFNSIAEHLAYIPQEPVLFNRSIKENIIYLNNEVDAETFEDVIKVTSCQSFIDKLPNKYETILSNLGNNLSAGQKQRVALARALCSKAKWLILDEPTSALDGVTELMLIKDLFNYCKDHTLIIITHNPQIMKVMDEVIFLQSSDVVAQGKPDQLKANYQPYQNFVNGVNDV